MNILIKIFKNIYFLNLKTIYVNFKYLPFHKAIKFPIFVSKHTYLKECLGTVEILSERINTGMIRIRQNSVGIFDEKKSRNIWQVSGKIIFKGRCVLGQGTKLSVGGTGILTLGENFKISAETAIICHQKIIFGKDCLLSWNILVMDTDLHKIMNKSKEIIVGDHVWIGCNTTILKGSLIPDNNVIGANTILNKRLNNTHSIFAGNPIKIVKNDIDWNE